MRVTNFYTYDDGGVIEFDNGYRIEVDGSQQCCEEYLITENSLDTAIYEQNFDVIELQPAATGFTINGLHVNLYCYDNGCGVHDMTVCLINDNNETIFEMDVECEDLGCSPR